MMHAAHPIPGRNRKFAMVALALCQTATMFCCQIIARTVQMIIESRRMRACKHHITTQLIRARKTSGTNIMYGRPHVHKHNYNMYEEDFRSNGWKIFEHVEWSTHSKPVIDGVKPKSVKHGINPKSASGGNNQFRGNMRNKTGWVSEFPRSCSWAAHPSRGRAGESRPWPAGTDSADPEGHIHRTHEENRKRNTARGLRSLDRIEWRNIEGSLSGEWLEEQLETRLLGPSVSPQKWGGTPPPRSIKSN